MRALLAERICNTAWPDSKGLQPLAGTNKKGCPDGRPFLFDFKNFMDECTESFLY
jgi:hypothetical protein